MGEFSALTQAWIAGLACGFIVSVPVGPVNLAVIGLALHRGFLLAFLAGIGAVAAECAYALLMLTGYSTILDKPAVSMALRIVAVLVIAGLGVRSLLIKRELFDAQSSATAARVEERWHHPKSLLLGFILTGTNLTLLLLWATLTAMLYAREWVQPDWASRSACLAGVFVGGVIWFFLLAFFVSRAHRRVSSQAMMMLVRGSGVVFLIFAALLAVKLFR